MCRALRPAVGIKEARHLGSEQLRKLPLVCVLGRTSSQKTLCLLKHLQPRRPLARGGGRSGPDCVCVYYCRTGCVVFITVCVCLLLQDLGQSCLRGGGDMGGHVLRETTSRGLCELGCPSRTCERGVCVCVYYCRTSWT
jgi:hypothetical protein